MTYAYGAFLIQQNDSWRSCLTSLLTGAVHLSLSEYGMLKVLKSSKCSLYQLELHPSA